MVSPSPASPSPEPPRIEQPRYVLAVPDLARSAAYYRDVLGFEVREMGDPGWRWFQRDGCVIMAGHCPHALAPAELGDHNYFAYVAVNGVDALHAEFLTRGATLIKRLRSEPWGMREFGVRTVDGHRIMFGERLASAPEPRAAAQG